MMDGEKPLLRRRKRQKRATELRFAEHNFAGAEGTGVVQRARCEALRHLDGAEGKRLLARWEQGQAA